MPVLKKWFYVFAAALLLWPVLMFVLLISVYGGRLAPNYTSPLLEQLPILVMVALQLVLQLGLLATSIMLALRVKTPWKRIVLYAVALIALMFVYKTVRGLVTYSLLIS